jgi:hypothetical protein
MSFGMKYQAVRWGIGGLVVIGIAVTQAIFGWVGDSLYFRIVYPVLLLAGSAFFFLVSYGAWNYEKATGADLQPTRDFGDQSPSKDR